MENDDVRYEVSMGEIKKLLRRRNKNNFYKKDFFRLNDRDYRKFFIKRCITYLLISAYCIVFMLLLSASTSPLYIDYCDGDSSIFMLLGKGITLGKRIYADYFDHKGPILFYLNALGFYLTGTKTGVFIIQCIVFSATAIFMYKTARIFTKNIRSVICTVLSVLAFASTISDGNLSEEYCMLCCIIPIYLSLKFYTQNPTLPHPPMHMAIYGICFAVCAFIRVNNGVMIGGIVLISLLNDFISGNIRSSVINIAAFFLGMAAVVVPVCIFFIVKGTFSDMIFAAFTFNFMYAQEGGAEKNAEAAWQLFLWIVPVITLIITALLFSKRLGAKVSSIITTVSVFALIPALMGFSYTHYYTTFIPLITLYMAVFFFIATQRITFMSILLCALLTMPLYNYYETLPYNISHYLGKIYREHHPEIYDNTRSVIHYSAEQITRQIPENERDSVFGYDVSAAWFLEADIMPCFRLFTLQESWSEHYPEFGREINRMMTDDPPKWVIIHNIDIIESRQFLNIIDTEYEPVTEYGYDILYRHIE